MTNRCVCGCGKETRLNNRFINGHNGSMRKGWNHTRESIKLMSDKHTKPKYESFCLICNKAIINTVGVKARKFCSPKCHYKAQSGDGNPAKKPGIGKKISNKLLSMYHDGIATFGFKKGQHHSDTHCCNISKGITKAYKNGDLNNKLENHPNWQGGISKEEYGVEFNKELKEQIRKRDNYRCQQCFRHQNELFRVINGVIRRYKLCIHHINYNKKNNLSGNLISLCSNCHVQTNYKRKDWTEYFRNKTIL